MALAAESDRLTIIAKPAAQATSLRMMKLSGLRRDCLAAPQAFPALPSEDPQAELSIFQSREDEAHAKIAFIAPP